jgi:hypothetical protein
MRNQKLGLATALLLLVATPAAGGVVNVDIEGDPGNDTTHSGNDGVLSGAGTLWNGIEVGVDAADLPDEGGTPSGVDLVWGGASGTTDPSATNDLQDSGAIGSFTLKGLVQGTPYEVAIYGAPFAFLAITDSTGLFPLACTGSATYALPGTEDLDYCRLSDVMPADLGGGEFGITIDGIDGVVVGVQLLGPGGGSPPQVPALPPGAVAVLGVALLGSGLAASRRLRAGPASASG